MKFPHSLGLLYSAFTYYCGFKVNSGEYKLMGLAPYGKPQFTDLIHKHLLDLRPDGSFRMDMAYFNYCQGLTMTNERFHRLFGGPPRSPELPIEQRHMDLAASIQVIAEEIIMSMARELHRLTGGKNVVLAAGWRSIAWRTAGCCAKVLFQPVGPTAAGDAGGALGAALFAWHQLLEKPRQIGHSDSQAGSFLGPQFSDKEIENALTMRDLPSQKFEDEAALLKLVVDAMSDGKVVGWFQGRMEFGPRALGARSILGDARNPAMQSVMNLKIKYRESFRPFAPCILRERAADYFDLRPETESPYMLLVAPLWKNIACRFRRPSEIPWPTIPICDSA